MLKKKKIARKFGYRDEHLLVRMIEAPVSFISRKLISKPYDEETFDWAKKLAKLTTECAKLHEIEGHWIESFQYYIPQDQIVKEVLEQRREIQRILT